jgi:hypothetical protein
MFMRSLVFLFLLSCSLTAFADKLSLKIPVNAKWKTECGSCHLAYPPAFLARNDWKQLMQKLDKHYGVDASVEGIDQQEITRFLQRYGAQGGNYSSKTYRISDNNWFKDEHEEVSLNTWKDPAVNSPANCESCHVNAAKGDWSERGIRVPGGSDEDEGNDDEDD